MTTNPPNNGGWPKTCRISKQLEHQKNSQLSVNTPPNAINSILPGQYNPKKFNLWGEIIAQFNKSRLWQLGLAATLTSNTLSFTKKGRVAMDAISLDAQNNRFYEIFESFFFIFAFTRI